MNKDEPDEHLSLTLRRVPRRLIEELYNAKAVTGRPVYDLTTEAIDSWLERSMRPYLEGLEYDEGPNLEDDENMAAPNESLP